MSDDTTPTPPSSSKKKRNDTLPEVLDSLTKDDLNLNCIMTRTEKLDAAYGNKKCGKECEVAWAVKISDGNVFDITRLNSDKLQRLAGKNLD